MCNFLSAIIMKNGDLLCQPDATDSHEDLLQFHNIRDGLAQQGQFVRLEFRPPADTSTIADLFTWQFVVDENKTPDWFDPEAAREKLAARVARMIIVADSRDLLLGGCWILVGNAEAKVVKNARIFGMYGSSRVGMMYDSSRVDTMYGSSQVGIMHDTSRVDTMRGTSRVEEMYEFSQVEEMYDSSRVDTMYDASRVGMMYKSSQVEEMYDSSQVGKMHDTSQVDKMYESSRVGVMRGSSQLPKGKKPEEDCRNG